MLFASDRDALEEMPIVANIQDATPICYQGKYAEHIFGILEKILPNPKQAGQFLDLHDGGKFQNKVPTFVDGMVTIDIFLVEAIAGLDISPGIRTPPTKTPFLAPPWDHRKRRQLNAALSSEPPRPLPRC
jgi:hypothetical protein